MELLVDAETYFFAPGGGPAGAPELARALSAAGRLAGAGSAKIIAFVSEANAARLAGALLAEAFWQQGAHVRVARDARAALRAAAAERPAAHVLSKDGAALKELDGRVFHTWTFARDGALRLVRSDARVARRLRSPDAAAAAPPPADSKAYVEWCDVRGARFALAAARAESPFEKAIAADDPFDAVRAALAADPTATAARGGEPRARDRARPNAAAKNSAAPKAQDEGKARFRRFTPCRSCGHAFVMTQGERDWFASKQFRLPSNCRPCRAERRATASASASVKAA